MPGNYLNNYGDLFLNYLPYQSLPYKLLWYTDGDILINRYEWNDKIDYIIDPQDSYYHSFFVEKWNREMVKKVAPPRSVSKEVLKTGKALWYIIRQKISWKFFHKKMKKIRVKDHISQI